MGVEAAGQVPGLADPVVVLAPESIWGRLGCAPGPPSQATSPQDRGSPRKGAPNLPQGAVAGVTEGALGAGPQGARRSSLGRGVENSPGSHGRLRHRGHGQREAEARAGGPVRTGTGGVGAVGTGRM